jgi:Ca2+-binding RTX toxin-like protein
VNLTTGAATRTGGVTNFRNVITGIGTDNITGNALDNVIQAGTGNDTLHGGAGGNDILVGNAGDDTITGGAGRSLLIGGAGRDRITAGSSQDILIGDSTDHDNNVAALDALMAEWKRTDLGYQDRINHLKGVTAGGANGTVYLTSSTVDSDRKTDELFGAGDLDWFWGEEDEEVLDLQMGEVVDD